MISSRFDEISQLFAGSYLQYDGKNRDRWIDKLISISIIALISDNIALISYLISCIPDLPRRVSRDILIDYLLPILWLITAFRFLLISLS